MSFRQPSILPGFGLTFGFTTVFLSTIVLLPLAALVLAAGSMHWSDFVHTVLSPRALGSYRLSFGASLLAACINLVFGFVIAWTLVRYEFPGRKLIDALITTDQAEQLWSLGEDDEDDPPAVGAGRRR